MFARKTTTQVRTMTRRSINAQFTRVAILVAVLFASVVAITPRPAAAHHWVGVLGQVKTTVTPSFLSVQVYDAYGRQLSTNLGVIGTTNFVVNLPANAYYYFGATTHHGKCGLGGLGYILVSEGGTWVYVGESTTSATVTLYSKRYLYC